MLSCDMPCHALLCCAVCELMQINVLLCVLFQVLLFANTGIQSCCCDMLQGIVELHEAGFCHLDLKPQNLCMLAGATVEELHPIIIDYGSAVSLETGEPPF